MGPCQPFLQKSKTLPRRFPWLLKLQSLLTQIVFETPQTGSLNPKPLFANPRLHSPARLSVCFLPRCRTLPLPLPVAIHAPLHHPIIDAYTAPLCCLPAAVTLSQAVARVPSDASALTAPYSSLQMGAYVPRGSAILRASAARATTVRR